MRRTLPPVGVVAALTVLSWAAGAHAATYRCQDASGKLVYSDRPCVSGQTNTGTLTEGGARKAAVEPPVSRAAAAASAVAATGGTAGASGSSAGAAASEPAAPASAATAVPPKR